LDVSKRLENVGKMHFLLHIMVKKLSKNGQKLEKIGKFSLFYCKDLLNTGQNVGKNGLPTCFLQVTYMGNSLTINEDVGNVGM